MNRSLYPFQLLSDIPALNLTIVRVPVRLTVSTKIPAGDACEFMDLDFAISWDADRDERVFPAVRTLWYRGLVPPQTLFVGERKGGLTITLDPEYPEPLPGGSLAAYKAAVEKAMSGSADPWAVYVATPSDWQVQIARLLKLGARIRDDFHAADLALQVPAAGWFA
jgi:hypothetical protein